MVIYELLDVLSPPQQPVDGGKGRYWGEITTYFGKPLPDDYVSFIGLYGSGVIGNWLTVFNPFSKNPNVSLTRQFIVNLSALSVVKEEFPESCPYPLLFEPGGLLPWGSSTDGDLYCWETRGIIGKLWKVVTIGRHSKPEEFDMPMARFLAQSISGEIKPKTIPAEWAEQDVKFTPIKAKQVTK